MALNERLQIIIDADARGASREMQRFGAATERSLGDAENRLDRMSGKLTSFGVKAVAAGAIASAGLFKLAQAAGDSAEALNKANVILGEEGTRALNEYAKTAAQTAGISQTAALEVGAQFGLFAQAAGLAGDQAGQFSAQMVQLAGDLSSIANVDTEQSLNAISAAFSGQTRPLRALGIFLDDYTLKQRLAAQTGEQVTGTLTTQQRSLAVYLELLNQGAKFSGDFENTQDSLQNRQRRLAAEFDNTQSKLGETLLPAFEAAIGGVQGLLSGFNALPQGAQAATVGFAGVATATTLAAGGLALVVGQGIRAVQTFGELTTKLQASGGALAVLGKAGPALGGAALAVGGIFALEAALSAAKDSAGKLEKAFERLEAASTQYEAAAAVDDAVSAKLQDQAWSLFNLTGQFSEARASADAFNDALSTSTALAQLYIDAIKGSDRYKIVEEGEVFRMEEVGDRILQSKVELEQWQAQIDSKKESDIKAAFAQKQYNKEVAEGVAELEAVAGITDAAAEATENDTAAKERAERATARLNRVLGQLNATKQLASLSFDTAKAKADAFAESLAQATQASSLLAAGVSAGRGLQNLRRGLGLIPDDARKAERGLNAAGIVVDRLGRAASDSDPALSRLGISLGSAGAAASAFTASLAAASGVGQRLDSALSINEAFDNFRRTFRRLPQDLDVASISLGRLRPRQRDAIQNLLQLGRATGEYLGTLIKTGAGQDEVRREAARLREEYVKQLRQLGLNEKQVAKYLEILGLAPKQIETAISVSGVEQARFKVNAYLQLLQGKIPEDVATSIVPLIEAGNLEGAARRLAEFAAKNPAVIDVAPKGTKELKEAERTLFDLPKRYDAVAAATGKYSEAQLDALDGVLQLGQAARDYLQTLIASGADGDKVEAEAKRLRDAYAEVFTQLGITGEALEGYYELLGIADDQVVTAIKVSGLEESIFKIQTYFSILENIDQLSPDVQFKVAAELERGDYDAAVATLEAEVKRVQIEADAAPARRTFFDWMREVATAKPKAQLDADPAPARRTVFDWMREVTSKKTDAPLTADDSRARTTLEDFRNDAKNRFVVSPFDIDLGPATLRAFSFFNAFPALRPPSLQGGRAMGGPVGSGSWLVGERGPEILSLGTGARGTVSSAQQSARTLSSPSASDDTAKALLRAVKELSASLSDLDGGVSVGQISVQAPTSERTPTEMIRALRSAAWLMRADMGA